jgi:putative ABC transport system permease protein
METLVADLRQAIRGLRQSPGFAVAAIGILALGLAANTAVFSVADAVLFRPLPFQSPQQLVAIHEVIPQFSQRYPRLPVNAKHFFEWQARSRSFADLAILQDSSLNLTGNEGPPTRLAVERVSWNYLPLLGVQPLLGRNFTAEEDHTNNDRVVILTYGLWQRRFHGDASILNRTILLSGTPHVVVGMLPAWFRYPRSDGEELGGRAAQPEIFKPIAIDRAKLDAMGNHNFITTARLRDGVSAQQALADLNSIQAALIHETPMPGLDLRADVTPLQEQVVAGSRQGLLVLLASIGTVLLIICVNLGNLMLARATGRSREMAIRAALGAGSWRMIRQVLTESLVIAFAGGALGLMLAYAAVRALVASAPVDLPRLDEVHLDLRALLFAFAVSLVAGLLFGLIPAWRAARSEPQDALRGGGRSATQGRGGLRIAEILVTTEVALSAALLVAAGLLIGSLVRILGIEQGFQASNVLTASLNLPGTKYDNTKKRAEFFDRLLPAVQRLPGIQAAGIISTLPLQGDTWVDMISRDDDHRPLFERPIANYRFISPDYFAALGISIRAGRAFQLADRNRPVVVVTATTAARIWPGSNAIGKQMRRSNEKEPMAEVVGVVTDTRVGMHGDPPPLMVYMPYWTQLGSEATLTIRTAQEPGAAANAVRNAIWSVDSQLPVPEMKTMQRIISDAVSERRFQTGLLAGFALAALLLAVVGIYGVISYSVNRRRNEIAIRMALGAGASDVNRMVLGQGMRPVAAGLVIGMAVALALGRLVQALLFQTRPSDPLVLVSVVFVLGAAAALACFAPARRATRVDPAISLRYE